MQTDKQDQRIVRCESAGRATCPRSQGYGLGFEVIDYGRFERVGHSGSDWSEMALAYFYAPSRDAVIVFLNAPNARALSAMPDMLLLDPSSPYLPHYRAWLQREIESERNRTRSK